MVENARQVDWTTGELLRRADSEATEVTGDASISFDNFILAKDLERVGWGLNKL